MANGFIREPQTGARVERGTLQRMQPHQRKTREPRENQRKLADSVEPVTVKPDEACWQLFNHDHSDGGREIISAIFKPHAMVAVKGCHASGKTFAGADIVLLTLFMGGDVITTAPTDDQVKNLMWAQIHEAIKDSNVDGWGTILQKEIRMERDGDEGEANDDQFARGRSTSKSVFFHGYHAKSEPGRFLLIIIDEAPGIDPGIFNAIRGIRAGGDVRVLMLGNPDEPSGEFYDAFNGNSELWHTITLDAFENPNMLNPGTEQPFTLPELLALPEHELDNNVRPYLATRRWVKEMWTELKSEDNPVWQAKVRGQFPQNSQISLFLRSQLEEAGLKDVKRPTDPKLKPRAGIDCAGPGEDETVMYVRWGESIVGMYCTMDADPVPYLTLKLKDWERLGLDAAMIDSAGLGWGYYTELQRTFGKRIKMIPVNVGKMARDDDAQTRFVNMKAEVYYGFHEALDAGRVRGLVDPKTREQLAQIRYKHQAGRILVESKDDMKKRGVKGSPDRAEGLILSWVEPSQAQVLAAAIASQATTDTAVLTPEEQRLPWNRESKAQPFKETWAKRAKATKRVPFRTPSAPKTGKLT